MIIERAQEIVQKIQAEGVRATYDAREAANAPVVLVGPPTVEPQNRCACTYTWPIYALAPMPADADVLGVIGPQLDAIYAAGFRGDARPVTYPSASGDLSAYQIDYVETL